MASAFLCLMADLLGQRSSGTSEVETDQSPSMWLGAAEAFWSLVHRRQAPGEVALGEVALEEVSLREVAQLVYLMASLPALVSCCSSFFSRNRAELPAPLSLA